MYNSANKYLSECNYSLEAPLYQLQLTVGRNGCSDSIWSPQVSFNCLHALFKHNGVPLPALDSKQIKNLIWFSRTLVNVMGEYFANEIVKSCGKGYETEVTKMG